MNNDSSLISTVLDNWRLLMAWAGSITLGQFQSVLGIISTLLVIGYTVWKWRREARQ